MDPEIAVSILVRLFPLGACACRSSAGRQTLPVELTMQQAGTKVGTQGNL